MHLVLQTAQSSKRISLLKGRGDFRWIWKSSTLRFYTSSWISSDSFYRENASHSDSQDAWRGVYSQDDVSSFAHYVEEETSSNSREENMLECAQWTLPSSIWLGAPCCVPKHTHVVSFWLLGFSEPQSGYSVSVDRRLATGIPYLCLSSMDIPHKPPGPSHFYESFEDLNSGSFSKHHSISWEDTVHLTDEYLFIYTNKNTTIKYSCLKSSGSSYF